MVRMRRAAISLALVIAAFTAYRVIAVPLIEPGIENQVQAALDESRVDRARNSAAEERRELASWFNPGDWELTSAKVIDTPRGRLLLNNYQNLGDGRIKIRPCTIIFLPEGKFENAEERRRRAVIVQAPDGAVLQFDGKFELKQAKVGKLIGGRLVGPVTIRSEQKLPTPDDDLYVRTQDVDLAEALISTPNRVDLRLGQNIAHGSDLLIHLARSNANVTPGDPLPPQSIRLIELRRDVHVRFTPGQSNFLPGSENKQGWLPGTAENKSEGKRQPIEITCTGPFTFDVAKKVAAFQDQVHLQRLQEGNVPPDTLDCDRFSLFFEEVVAQGEAVPAEKGSAAMPKLKPARFVAVGDPVKLVSPSNELHGTATEIEYDVKTGAGKMIDDREVFLHQKGQEIHAKQLYFRPEPNGKLGEVLATGTGWLKAFVPGEGKQPVEAAWNKSFHFRKDEQFYVLSVDGEAMVRIVDRGEITSEVMHLWLIENNVPRPKEKSDDKKIDLLPHRMLAEGTVQIASPQLSTEVDRLRMWFTNPQPPAAPPTIPQGPPAAENTQREEAAGPALDSPGKSAARLDAPKDPPNEDADADADGEGETVPRNAGTPSRHLHVKGARLEIQVDLRGKKPQVTEAVVEERVDCEEQPAVKTAAQPLHVTGDRLHVKQSSAQESLIVVTGSPARIDAQGMSLIGNQVNLDRIVNRAWVVGAGEMLIPVSGELNGLPGMGVFERREVNFRRQQGGDGDATSGRGEVGAADTLRLSWRGGLEFDGEVAVFSEDVHAKTQRQDLQTAQLKAYFAERISFADGKAPPRPEVKLLECLRGVEIHQEQVDEKQRLVSRETIFLKSCSIDRVSGDIHALGPGSIETIRLGTQGIPLGAQSEPKAPSKVQRLDGRPADQESINYLKVDFQRELLGNLHEKTIELFGQVEAVYGPVETWESKLSYDQPEALGPKGILLSANQLKVSQAPISPNGTSFVELRAMGNTVVEGVEFTARAQRMTYAQAKDLLILEGDGRSNAKLFQQERVGGKEKRFDAQKLLYWRAIPRVEVGDAEYLDLSNLPMRGEKEPEKR